jgi:hypothetical protein
MIAGDAYPKHFLPFTRNTANIVAIVGQEYPGEPADIPIFCEDDSKVILVSSSPLTVEDKSLSGPGALGNSWRSACIPMYWRRLRNWVYLVSTSAVSQRCFPIMLNLN